MITKILTFAAIALAGYFFFTRSRRASAASRRSQTGAGEDLIACARCGAYRRKSAICDCDRAPAP